MPPSGGSMYPRGNSRSATATPNGSPKRRLPQIPGQGGLPPSGSNRLASASNSRGGGMQRSMDGTMPYHASSYEAGLNGRGQGLHPSTRSRSMGPYGGYSDTEVMMAPSQSQTGGQYYGTGEPMHSGSTGGMAGVGVVGTSKMGYDPYYENTRGPYPMEDRGPSSYPVEDRRAQPPPPPPRNVNFEGDPPIKGSGGPRGAPPIGRVHHYGDSDMESVTSALSSYSAPHQRPRRPG